MSQWKPGWIERGENSFHLARSRVRCDGSRGDKIPRAVSGSPRSFIFRVANFAALCALAFAGWGSGILCAQEADFDKASYAHAVEYCRGDVRRPMALDPDKRILCFDGEISPGLDISLAKDLEEGGLFVVRSFGSDPVTAITLAELIRDRHATVVVNEYCVFACASYLLIASTKTYVLRDALVAWRHFGVGSSDCAGFARAKDEGAPRLEVGLCPNPPLEIRSESGEVERLKEQFYRERFVDSHFEFPPESFVVRRALKNLVSETGAYPNVMWTWNPRYFASAIKTKIFYESYPRSQSEVDAIAARLRLRYHVIYDP
jgi:hypothetical protein